MTKKEPKPKPFTLPIVTEIPVNLAASIEGKFFVGYADRLSFGKGTNAWAGLYNPPDSGVNLYIYYWSVGDIHESAYRMETWFNANMPGVPFVSPHVNPGNFTFDPLPVPKCQLISASGVTGEPSGGIKAFVRRGLPNTVQAEAEEGKFIFGPGGMFALFLSDPETPEVEASGTIYYEWVEEPVNFYL